MNAQYFIEKFEAIPEEMWTVNVYTEGDKCCAFGHCGVNAIGGTKESTALAEIIANTPGKYGYVDIINDGDDNRYKQPTPKQRILAALRDVQAAGF